MTIESIMDGVVNYDVLRERLRNLPEEEGEKLLESVMGRLMAMQLGLVEVSDASAMRNVGDSILLLATMATLAKEETDELIQGLSEEVK